MTKEDIITEEYIIDTKAVQTSFENELKQYNSSARIFFSGKYGVGKTKFLEKFFTDKKDEYLTINLFPVNYQISTNEDIINLLKYDILVKLFEDYEGYFKTNQNIPWYVLVKNYISQKSANEILSGTIDMYEAIPLIQDIPIIGKLGRPLKTLLNIDENFQEFKATYEEGGKGVVERYLVDIKTKDTTENDIISQIIKDTIQEIKDEKKSVLIIDDLDRLDPEHIFRILNILSAHFDQDRDNKFGFDYIIIVGDYYNIQKIFHHKYGEEIDFDGYMDKFYTVKPFEFDNKKALLSQLPDIIKSYQRSDSPKDSSAYAYMIIEDIIRKSIDINKINLRALLKNVNFNLLPVEQKYPTNLPTTSGPIIAIDILIDIFGTRQKLIKIIREIKGNETFPIPYGFIDKCKIIILQLYISVKEEALVENKHYPYKTYTLILDNDDVMTIKQGSDRDYLSLYYDLLEDWIDNKRDQAK
jgi:nucleoside-triphosphatase THEP1